MDDLPPPLEDATEVVNSIRKKIEKKKQFNDTKSINRGLLDIELNDERKMPTLVTETFNAKPVNGNLEKNKSKTVEQNKKTKQSKEIAQGGFAGFQSGFLMSGKSKAKTNVRKRPETVIKAKEQPKNNPLLIPEVQEEMKKELTTDEFLSSYQNDKKLMEQMADPRFARAIDFMSRDPQGCKDFYMKSEPEFFAQFMTFFGENMKRIGGKMEKLSNGNAPSPPISKRKTEDEKEMDVILNRADVKEATTNPEVGKLIRMLKESPEKAQLYLRDINSKTKKDIQILIDNGILRIQ